MKKPKQEDRILWERLPARPDPLADPITGREDLNELWGLYVLRRSRAPLLRLALALAPEETDVVADITLHDDKHGVDVPLADVVSLVVAGMLRKGLDADPVTHGYCEVLAADEDQPEVVREKLAELLAPEAGK